MDIFTNESSLPLEIDKEFIGLKIHGRNSYNNELAFIWKFEEPDNHYISINIPISDYPIVPDDLNPENYENYRHIKLELDYFILDEDLVKYEGDNPILMVIDRYLYPRFLSKLTKYGKLQPELYITPQKGWVIDGDGFGITTTFEWTENNKKKNEDNPDYIVFKNHKDGETTYNYLFSSDNYGGEDTSNHYFEASYLTKLSNTSLLISTIFPIILLFASIGIILKTIFINNNDIAFFISYSAILLGYIYLYQSYTTAGYKFPNQKIAIISIAVSFIVIIYGIATIPSTIAIRPNMSIIISYGLPA